VSESIWKLSLSRKSAVNFGLGALSTVTDSEVDFEGSITMTSSPWPVHLVGVGEVEANTGKLQNDCQRDCWLASTGPDQAEGHEKSKHDECKQSLPPDSAWNFSGDSFLVKRGVFNLFADP
jgi:hypothetical protein